MDIKTLYDANINNITIAKNAFDKLYSAFGQHMENWQHEVADRLANSHWTGTASDHAQARIRFLGTELQSAHTELDLVSKALAKAAEQFALAQAHLVYALDDAKNAKLNVAPDGGITWDKEPTSPNYAGAGAETTAIAISNRITAALNEADHADQEISARLNHFASNAGNGLGLDAATVAKDLTASNAGEQAPPAGTDPTSVKKWWNGLTETERQNFIHDHPDQIGNLDGVPAIARDQANRVRMKQTKQDLQLQLDHLGPEPPQKIDGPQGPVTNPDYMAWDAKNILLREKLKGIADIESRLGGAKLAARDNTPAFLLGFDTTKGNGRAIVSVNNPDTADNVVTFVPGTTSRFAAVSGDVDKADEMVKAATKVDGTKSTAAIAWVGYDAPQNKFPDAAMDRYADDAKQDLARFQVGLRSTHEGAPSHNTLMGHSYGTVAVGHTMRDLKPPVDDIVLVGSPGVGVDHAKDLNIDPSHVYVARGSQDTGIAVTAELIKRFGEDPMDPHFEAQHLYAGDSDHSHYWDPKGDAIKEFGKVITGTWQPS
ncbi:alpha/beta hydrolase [Kitasatospora sp. NPDC101155]|uniref:alpha/beta hydrolase n=1 Tax=Kitasatospora sp. NPDC101155 TaxID=3364097 RepID=UPI00381F0936